MSKWLYFLNLILIIPVTLCDKSVPCDTSDESCLTVARNPLRNLLNADPLHIDKIQAFEIAHMNITLNDTYIYGLSACEALELKFTPVQWFLSLFCPKITLETDYDIYGDVDSVHTEGKGRFKIIFEKYLIGMYGGYAAYADKNGEEHLKVTYFRMNYTKVQGKISYNLNDVSEGNNEKSVRLYEYFIKNWKTLHNVIGTPITHIVFDFLIHNVNEYLAILPNPRVSTKPLSIKNLTIRAAAKH